MAVRTELNGRTVASSPVAIDVTCVGNQSKYANAAEDFPLQESSTKIQLVTAPSSVACA
jgi:hypothetical protein